MVVSADSPEQIRGTVPVTVAPGDTLMSIMNFTDPNVNTATQSEILTNLENQVTKIDERVAKDAGYSINPNSINPNNIIPGEQLQVPVVNNTGNAVNSSTKQP